MTWRADIARAALIAALSGGGGPALAQFTVEPDYELTPLDRPLNLDLDYRATLAPPATDPQTAPLNFGSLSGQGALADGARQGPAFGRDLGGGWVTDPAILHRNQNPEAGHYHRLNQKLIGLDLRRTF